MKNLIVIDLDKTLIPFDSFKKYLFGWVRHFPLKIPLLLLERKLRITKQYQFKTKILNTVSTHPKFSILNREIAEFIIDNLSNEILNRVKEKSNEHSELLLLSASPNIYISLVGDYLGWNAKGSFFNSKGEFIHLYGSNKVEYVKRNFPKSDYSYYYAISDSDSDNDLLNLFKYSDKV